LYGSNFVTSPPGVASSGDRDEALLHVDELAVEVPRVAPGAVGVFLHLVLGAGRELEVAPLLALYSRSALAPLLGEPRLPDVRRLHDVVVDADDLRQLAHAVPSAPARSGPGLRT